MKGVFILKIGCCISIEHMNLAKTFEYDYVELSAREIMKMSDSQWNEKKEEILQVDIPILGLSAFADHNTPLLGPKADPQVWGTYLKTILKRASQLHVTYIGIGAPNARMIPVGYAYKRARDEMELFLLEAAKQARNYNITILYEALNPKECNFGNHTAEIYDTVKKINHPNLHIVYDVYHAINANETYEDARLYFDEIKHIHINSWDRNLKRFYLFEKDACYMNQLSLFLSSIPYNNTISVEAFDADFVHTGATSVNIIKHALAFANNSKSLASV